MKRLLNICVSAILAMIVGFNASAQQAVDMVIDNPQIAPSPSSFPGTVTFSFTFYTELGSHLMSSDDLASNYTTITVSLSKLNGAAVMPTGAGADLFTWTYDPVTATYTGKSKDVLVVDETFYPIVFTGVATTAKSTANDVGFNANLTPAGDLLNSESNDDATSIFTSSPLPVTLVSFDGAREGNVVVLNWATTEETNSDYFEIQHSVNGKNWNNIGRVKSHGESTVLRSYDFTHQTPDGGDNLYRLKMVDNDLTFAYSSIRNVNMGGVGSKDIVYPNPVEGSLYVKNIESVAGIRITNIQGNTVYHSSTSSEGAFNIGHLCSGIHLVEITRKNGSRTVQRIVIR